MKDIKIKFGWRPKPHDKDCYCCDYPAYKFKFWPTLILWGFNTRKWSWLWWSLLITWKSKQK